MQIDRGFAAVNGTSLYYELAGAGDTIVFIHGLGLDRRLWDEQFDRFSHEYRVVRYDLREFGRSARSGGDRFLHADDLHGLLEHVGIERAHLIGSSMGGRVAISSALLYPASVRSLVLVDATVEGYAFTDAFDAGLAAIGDRARTHGTAAANELWFDNDLFASARASADSNALLKTMIGEYSGDMWRVGTRERGSRPRPLERLHELNVPTLVVVGEHDVPDFQRIAGVLAREIAHARYAVVEDAGHLPALERPERFGEIVLQFFRELKAPEPPFLG